MTQKLYEYTELTKLERAFLIYVFKHTDLPLEEDNNAFVVFRGIQYDDTTGFTKRQVRGIASSLVKKGILRTYVDNHSSWFENGKWRDGDAEIGTINWQYQEKYIDEDKYFKMDYGAFLTEKGREVDA